ncbi:MAG: hypothetical protein K6G11_04765 [Lachnospiraceae bacterium]|nr:hypothetical protein [Lachnospiraceae bacterium]
MNEGSYSDTLVKVEVPKGKIFLRYFMVAVAAILLVIGLGIFLQNPGLFIIFLIIDVVLIWFLPPVKIEYEYVYVDGQIDFDRIIAGNSRKNMARVDLENAIVVAEENSHDLDSYKNLKPKNFSSNREDQKHYVIVVNGGESGNYSVKFTPDETLLKEMKDKSPFKVKTEFYH